MTVRPLLARLSVARLLSSVKESSGSWQSLESDLGEGQAFGKDESTSSPPYKSKTAVVGVASSKASRVKMGLYSSVAKHAML